MKRRDRLDLDRRGRSWLMALVQTPPGRRAAQTIQAQDPPQRDPGIGNGAATGDLFAPVRIEHQAPDHPHIGTGVEIVDQTLERIRRDQAIGIEEQQPLGTCQGQCPVVGSGETEIGAVLQDPQARVSAMDPSQPLQALVA
jgi:hypothetical protein